MRAEETKDFSLFVTSFYLKLAGIWIAANPTEERRRRNAFTFAFIFMVLGLVIHLRDVYFSSANSFEDTMLALCNLFTGGLVTAKVTALYLHKKQFKELLVYLENNFWHTKYDTNEKTFLNQCKAQCIFFICSFNFFAQGTALCFLIEPCMAYFGNNDFARKLLFNLHADIFVQPYIFEITFLVQICILFYYGIGYLCVDNFVCVVNLHIATQFRILQYRIVNVHAGNNVEKHTVTSRPIPGYYADNCYATFKDCIKQHQALIAYCQKVEQLFTFIVLGQILVFSILMCLDGYLMFLEEASTAKRVTFTFHLTGCTCQLLMFTYSCDCVLRQSLEIAESAYSTEWPALRTNRSGKNMESDLQLVMVRSRVPCCLTAGGFFTVSLETYTRGKLDEHR
ncbi:odorant receptor 13a-like isoform X2 [Megalopta genalis]|uniref:odorant receptor 13a-like isoform X2 n=1 Tax=Megalopta genalis TaxID=115081 RepID=UPI003FD57403